jgi:hypothetical protein
MALVDITMSVDGGDTLNEIDLRRLKELWEIYSPSLPPSQAYGFDRLKDQVQRVLADHIRRNPTWFGSRPIFVNAAMSHRMDGYNRHIVILPQRVTWEAVNHGYDYLRNTAPQRLDVGEQEFDSTIRHWAGDNLAKYLDVHGGFSRLTTDRADCFNLILALQVARCNMYNSEEVIGSVFDVEVHENLQNQRETELLFMTHRCKPIPG